MYSMKKNSMMLLQLFMVALMTLACSKKSTTPTPTPTPPTTPPVLTNDVEFWLSRADRGVLLQQQSGTIGFTTVPNSNQEIVVDSSQRFQEIDGFGYTLTGGSAQVIRQLPTTDRANLLQELFGNGPTSIRVSYLRISVGASDLSPTAFTYNDMPAGQTDPTLANFSLGPDRTDVIPLLKEILAINPNIKILGSPWSAPAWMKDNGSLIGGSLLTTNFNVYAQYLVKYIQQMQAEGIRIDAITVQNEPQHGGNNPSMVMSATDQRDFIKNSLGPAFQAAGINTKIIIWDHNCDNPGYPITILNDPDAKRYVNGSAFHLYAGDISAMSSVKAAHPDRELYFTEQWTGANGSFDGDFKWHIRNVMIGSLRNWSRNALQWNLATNASFGPFTPGGCNQCKGALTISGTTVTRNVAYYNVAQLSKFIPPGSVRIASTQTGSLYTVAVVRPDGKKVLVVLNDGNSEQTFNIWYQSRWAAAKLPANSAGTFIW